MKVMKTMNELSEFAANNEGYTIRGGWETVSAPFSSDCGFHGYFIINNSGKPKPIRDFVAHCNNCYEYVKKLNGCVPSTIGEMWFEAWPTNEIIDHTCGDFVTHRGARLVCKVDEKNKMLIWEREEAKAA